MQVDITRATEIHEILECVPIEMEIRKKETERIRLKDALAFMEDQLDKPYFGFYIAREGEKIVGFLVLFYIPIKGFEQVQIMRIWYDIHYPETMQEFEQIIRQWKRETKAQRVTAMMDLYGVKGRNNIGRIRAFIKRWKFKPVALELERRN